MDIYNRFAPPLYPLPIPPIPRSKQLIVHAHIQLSTMFSMKQVFNSIFQLSAEDGDDFINIHGYL